MRSVVAVALCVALAACSRDSEPRTDVSSSPTPASSAAAPTQSPSAEPELTPAQMLRAGLARLRERGTGHYRQVLSDGARIVTAAEMDFDLRKQLFVGM